MLDELSHDNPSAEGWYATLHAWDVQEGFFPDAHYWNGKEWLDEHGRSTNASVMHWPTVFESYGSANAFAWEHDPDL